jgi:hypothetical protein
MSEATAQSAAGDESEVTSLFYIPAATSLPERRLRALKHGDTFALFNHYGDIVPFRGAPTASISLMATGSVRCLSDFANPKADGRSQLMARICLLWDGQSSSALPR